MANSHEHSAGIHGYSAPSAEEVIFEMPGPFPGAPWSQDHGATLLRRWTGAEPVCVAGCWEGKESLAFVLPRAAFDELRRRAPGALATERCVLVLGRLEARNWRKASLLWLRGPKAGTLEPIGTWHSATEAEARARDGWTRDQHGHYWVVSAHPPTSVSARDIRALPVTPVPDGYVPRSRPRHADQFDYSAEPGGAELHSGQVPKCVALADAAEDRGDMPSAAYWLRLAVWHATTAARAFERREGEALAKVQDWQAVDGLRRRAAVWELLAKAASCAVGRRNFIRPAMVSEAVSWSEAEAALAWIEARRKGGAE